MNLVSCKRQLLSMENEKDANKLRLASVDKDMIAMKEKLEILEQEL